MSAILSKPRPHGYRAPARLEGASTTAQLRDTGIDGEPSGAGFVALLIAYRSSGGTVRGDDLAALLQDHRQGNDVSLARMIGSGSILGFKWRETLWIPMFQFDPIDLSVTQGLREVLRELVGVIDSWQLASWFAEPNSALDGRLPAESLVHDWPSVLRAAHASRILLTR